MVSGADMLSSEFCVVFVISFAPLLSYLFRKCWLATFHHCLSSIEAFLPSFFTDFLSDGHSQLFFCCSSQNLFQYMSLFF